MNFPIEVESIIEIVLKRIIYFIIFFSAVFLVVSINGATKTKSKRTPDAATVLEQGREAFLNYDFEEAADLFEQYRALKKKAKQEPGEEFELMESQLEIATGAFDRVQKIVIIDSIGVSRNDFFKSYKLADSAGKIGIKNSLGISSDDSSQEVGFISENKDYAIWPAEDSEGGLILKEGRKLLDGTWETIDALNGSFEKNGDYAFPFMSGDGQTLYFSNNGLESMGGYDLFVVQKQPITGDCLQPLNLGMPFNSPFDDFMMAVDEETGLGWWATDRNDPGGDLTIYVFLLDEVRKNYPSDTPNLKDLAKISDYKATQDSTQLADYRKILRNLPK